MSKFKTYLQDAKKLSKDMTVAERKSYLLGLENACTGRTTKLLDMMVQQLFTEGEVHVLDHLSNNGTDLELLRKLKMRLEMEHGGETFSYHTGRLIKVTWDGYGDMVAFRNFIKNGLAEKVLKAPKVAIEKATKEKTIKTKKNEPKKYTVRGRIPATVKDIQGFL